jgi:hypothetical protein
VLLYCYHYDPATGKYGAVVSNMLRLGGALTILMLGGLLFILLRLDKAASARRKHNQPKSGHPESELPALGKIATDQAGRGQARPGQARPGQAGYVR